MEEKKIKDHVNERYSKIATKKASYCSCCGGTEDMLESALEQAKAMGYSEEELDSIPPDAIYGLGCGNPTALAEISEGETVLDLGSGGGIDVFLSSKKVGANGKVIGVDMTHEMVKTAIQNAEEGGLSKCSVQTGRN